MTTSSRLSMDGVPSGSASCIVTGPVSGCLTLKIVGYSRTKEFPSGKWIESCPFRVGDHTWHVRYYPNGNDFRYIDFISLHLVLDDSLAEAETVKAHVKFILADQDGIPSYSRIAMIKDFSMDTKSLGFADFIKRVELEKLGHVKDDSFIVVVIITIKSECLAQETRSIVVPPSDMHRHFGDLLLSRAGVDVEFRVSGETFWAHRSVLAARSPVFRAQFFGLMKEGATTEAICIDDMEAQVFNALLSFMYTDTLPDMKQEEEYAMAQHLLVAADWYDLDRLKLICQDKLSSGIDTSSVATILTLADQHHCHELKAVCLEFLRLPTHLDEAIDSEGFELLAKSCPGVMKDLLRLHVVPSLPGKRKSKA